MTASEQGLEWLIGPDMYDHLPPEVLDEHGQPDEHKVRDALAMALEARKARRSAFCQQIATGSDEDRQRVLNVMNERRAWHELLRVGIPAGGPEVWLERVRVLAERDHLPDVVLERFAPLTEAEGILTYVRFARNPRDFTPKAPEYTRGTRELDYVDAPLLTDNSVAQSVAEIRALADEHGQVHVSDLTMFGVFNDSEDCSR